jgi:uncharacterized protein YuzE
MEQIKILEREQNLDWEYDEEGDVLYISIGNPKKALGIDIGEGIVVRYREDAREIVGLTILGVKERLLSAVSSR